MIPIRDKNTDISTEIAQGRAFKKKLQQLADEVSGRFLKGENLNDLIAEVAKREHFNQLQIQRLIEEGNTISYTKKYETVRHLPDRRITFELAELEKVLERMGSDAPPKIDNPNLVSGKTGEGEMKKVASTQSTLHYPHANLEHAHEKLASQKERQQTEQEERSRRKVTMEAQSAITKIAGALVETQKRMQNGNHIFNCLLDDVSLSEEAQEQIQKKASAMFERLTERGLMHARHVTSFQAEPSEKIASPVLGKYSLLKTASERVVTPPRLASSSYAIDYPALVQIANKLRGF